MIALARYSHLAKDNPAKDILPSFVMYTCHLFVILSLCQDNQKKWNTLWCDYYHQTIQNKFLFKCYHERRSRPELCSSLWMRTCRSAWVWRTNPFRSCPLPSGCRTAFVSRSWSFRPSVPSQLSTHQTEPGHQPHLRQSWLHGPEDLNTWVGQAFSVGSWPWELKTVQYKQQLQATSATLTLFLVTCALVCVNGW